MYKSPSKTPLPVFGFLNPPVSIDTQTNFSPVNLFIMPKKVTFSDDTKGSRFDFATPRAESIKPSYTVTRTRLEDQILEKLKLAESSVNKLQKKR